MIRLPADLLSKLARPEKWQLAFRHARARLAPHAHVRASFRRAHGREPDLQNPRTFSEKLAWRWLYERDPLLAVCSDKVKVRDWVRGKIGRDLAPELLGTWRRVSPDDLAALPPGWVIKTSHGSGILAISRPDAPLDPAATARRFNRLIDTPAWGEWVYGWLPPDRTILAERLLSDAEGEVPADYKFHCFHQPGGAFDWMLQIDAGRYGDHRQDYLDSDLRRLPLVFGDMIRAEEYPALPERLDEMVSIARRLSDDFTYSRVDLYEAEGRVWFGEMTFTHRGGYDPITPPEWEEILGAKWAIPGH